MDSKAKNAWKRGFFTLASGQAFSLIGSSAVQFTLIWWLADSTGSALMLSVAGLAAFLPQLILGPFAGVWIDRLKRKRIIICADLFIGLCAAVFAVLFLFMDVPHWVACAVLGLRAVGNVFHTPAISAALPMIVPEQELVRANGWTQFFQSGAFMLGPVLGAALYAALPLPFIMLIDAGGAAVASICTGLVKIPDPKPQRQERQRLLSELKSGVEVILTDKKLSTLMFASTACMLFILPLSSLYPLMSSDHFSATAWHGGLVESLYAGGMMLAAAIVGAKGKIKDKLKTAHFGLFLMGISSLLCGLLPASMVWFWVFAALCAVMGGSGNVYNIPLMAYMQQTIPPEKQGRAFSLMGSLMSLAMPLGLMVAGPAAEYGGVELWFFLSGAAIILITAVSMLITARAGR